jgi:hypothetical protein
MFPLNISAHMAIIGCYNSCDAETVVFIWSHVSLGGEPLCITAGLNMYWNFLRRVQNVKTLHAH